MGITFTSPDKKTARQIVKNISEMIGTSLSSPTWTADACRAITSSTSSLGLFHLPFPGLELLVWGNGRGAIFEHGSLAVGETPLVMLSIDPRPKISRLLFKHNDVVAYLLGLAQQQDTHPTLICDVRLLRVRAISKGVRAPLAPASPEDGVEFLQALRAWSEDLYNPFMLEDPLEITWSEESANLLVENLRDSLLVLGYGPCRVIVSSVENGSIDIRISSHPYRNVRALWRVGMDNRLAGQFKGQEWRQTGLSSSTRKAGWQKVSANIARFNLVPSHHGRLAAIARVQEHLRAIKACAQTSVQDRACAEVFLHPDEPFPI